MVGVSVCVVVRESEMDGVGVGGGVSVRDMVTE